MRQPTGVLVAFLVCLVLSAAPAAARAVVSAPPEVSAGTIVVKTGERRLYFGLGDGRALSYQVAVGRAGKQWSGQTRIVGKAIDPVWAPPPAVRAADPRLPALVPPGPRNPLGPRALVLAADQYAIHGTNDPSSIGRAVSWGCIRMHNADIVDLFQRVRVGTPVKVVP